MALLALDLTVAALWRWSSRPLTGCRGFECAESSVSNVPGP
jgi:hypothetical protein